MPTAALIQVGWRHAAAPHLVSRFEGRSRRWAGRSPPHIPARCEDRSSYSDERTRRARSLLFFREPDLGRREVGPRTRSKGILSGANAGGPLREASKTGTGEFLVTLPGVGKARAGASWSSFARSRARGPDEKCRSPRVRARFKWVGRRLPQPRSCSIGFTGRSARPRQDALQEPRVRATVEA